jgi:hypothetical protein
VSLVAAITPLGKGEGGRNRWLTSATAYTTAGVATSALVGASLGLVGRSLLPEQIGGLGFAIVIAVAATGAMRELGWVSIPLPEWRRQTQPVWVSIFGNTLGATFWGFELGLVFTHWLTFSGVWLLVSIAVLTGETGFGISLFVAHWLGSALSVWIAPFLVGDAGVTRLTDEIFRQRKLLRRVHLLALVWSVGVLITWLYYGAKF